MERRRFETILRRLKDGMIDDELVVEYRKHGR